MLNRLLFALLRARARRAIPEEPLNFWQELAEVKTVLVALPRVLEQPKQLSHLVTHLVQLFGAGQVRFIAREGQPVPAGIEKAWLWEIDAKELRFKCLPRRRLWGMVSAHRAEAFIDLHEQFDFLSAALAVASGARLRICFAHEQRDPFYNLQVRTSPGLSSTKRYKKLIALLESSRAGTRKVGTEDVAQTGK